VLFDIVQLKHKVAAFVLHSCGDGRRVINKNSIQITTSE